MAENASMFVSYNQIQNAVRWYSGQSPADELTLGQLSVAAAGAGAITSFFLYVPPHLSPLLFSLGSLSRTSLTHALYSIHHGPNRTPIELVKCKMQVQMLLTPPASLEVLAPLTNSGVATLGGPSGSKPHKLPGPIAVLKSVVQTSGLRGLWLGQTGTLIRETGGGAAWFVSKEAVARLLISRRPSSSSSASTSPSDGGPSKKQHLAVWESAVSGGFAGLAYNVALFPADTVKSAVQTEAEMRPRAPGELYPSFVATARAMYKAQGLRGLYAGCGITAARAVPSSALIFVIYDGLTKRFG